MFVGSSKDILYLVIAICIGWVTVFLCWMLYYVMRILRNTNEIVEEFRMRLQNLFEAVNYIRGKVEHISSVLAVATEGVGGLVKRAVVRKTKEWMEGGEVKANAAAKQAVERAVSETAKRMRKAASKIRR